MREQPDSTFPRAFSAVSVDSQSDEPNVAESVLFKRGLLRPLKPMEEMKKLRAQASGLLKTIPNHHTPLEEGEDPYTKNHAIGECHTDISPKRYLIEHMAAYKANGYTTLFIEHLFDDKHQADLDTFNKSGVMSESLSEYLKEQNRGHMRDNYHHSYNYLKVIQAAQKQGIRVVAIDTSVSYAFTDGAKHRAQAFSKTAKEIIEREAGSGKWIAFTGNYHNFIQEGIPGLANIFPNTIAINVFDKRASKKNGSLPLEIKRRSSSLIDPKTMGSPTVYSDIEIRVEPSTPLTGLQLHNAIPSEAKQATENLSRQASSTNTASTINTPTDCLTYDFAGVFVREASSSLEDPSLSRSSSRAASPNHHLPPSSFLAAPVLQREPSTRQLRRAVSFTDTLAEEGKNPLSLGSEAQESINICRVEPREETLIIPPLQAQQTSAVGIRGIQNLIRAEHTTFDKSIIPEAQENSPPDTPFRKQFYDGNFQTESTWVNRSRKDTSRKLPPL